MNEQSQFDFLDMLTMVSFILQIFGLTMMSDQATNNDVMQELRTQDSKYLETIIKQNEKIIELLQTSSDHSAQSI